MHKLAVLAFAATASLVAGSTTAHAQVIAPIGGIVLPACTPTLNWTKSLPWSSGSTSSGGKKWNVGIAAGTQLFADCSQLSAKVSAELDASIYSLTIPPPVSVSLTAATKSDHTNSITAAVTAFGYDLKTKTIANSASPISGGFTADPTDNSSYMLPTSLKGSWTYAPSWADGAAATITYDTVADLSVGVSYSVAPTGVSVRTLGAANVSANLAASIMYKGFALSTHDVLDIARLVQGGHAALAPDTTTGAWKADVGNSLSVTDVLGIDLTVDVPVLGDQTIFSMKPKSYSNDYVWTTSFAKPF